MRNDLMYFVVGLLVCGIPMGRAGTSCHRIGQKGVRIDWRDSGFFGSLINNC